MAEDRKITTCEERRLLYRHRRWDGMADQIDAPVNLMETPVANAQGNLMTAYAGCDQLTTGDHPMLPRGELRDDPVSELSE